MAGKTTIEWTAMPGFAPAVWNPTTGCTRVSAGCDNCYAFALHDKRYATNLSWAVAIAESNGYTGPRTAELIAKVRQNSSMKLPWPKQYDVPFSHVQLLEDRVDAPLHRRTPTCYFVDSMADLFHNEVPDEFIERVWKTMVVAEEHRFLILTKRPERMRSFATRWIEREAKEALALAREFELNASLDLRGDGDLVRTLRTGAGKPPSNIWLGTSVEDQAAANERIPHLLATPAAVRFLSCEPLLGPVDLVSMFDDGRFARELERGVAHYNVRLDWVIAGGESGPRARPMDLAWARSLRDQCAVSRVSFFMKQLGSKPVERDELADDAAFVNGQPVMPVRLHESHGRDVEEWPEDLRIRTWPNGGHFISARRLPDMLLRELASGPGTTAELVQRLHVEGGRRESARVANELTQLKAAGTVQHDSGTGNAAVRWRLASGSATSNEGPKQEVPS